jgi:hypothetical protein
MRGQFLRLMYSQACLTRLNINNLCLTPLTRRHQQLSAMTPRQLRETQCVTMRSKFVLLSDSNA